MSVPDVNETPEQHSTTVEVLFRSGDEISPEKVTLYMADVDDRLKLDEQEEFLDLEIPAQLLPVLVDQKDAKGNITTPRDTDEQLMDKARRRLPYEARNKRYNVAFVKMFTKGYYPAYWDSDPLFISALQLEIQVFIRAMSRKDADARLHLLAQASEQHAKAKAIENEKNLAQQKAKADETIALSKAIQDDNKDTTESKE